MFTKRDIAENDSSTNHIDGMSNSFMTAVRVSTRVAEIDSYSKRDCKTMTCCYQTPQQQTNGNQIYLMVHAILWEKKKKSDLANEQKQENRHHKERTTRREKTPQVS